MDALDFAAIAVSFISLAIAVYFSLKALKLSELSLKSSSRQEHLKCLLELDRLGIEKPELWAVYDSNPLYKKTLDPETKVALDAFVYHHLNIFELVHDFYKDTITKDKIDSEYWKAWDRYIHQFFEESSAARALFKERRTYEVYPEHFVKYVNGIIDKTEKK